MSDEVYTEPYVIEVPHAHRLTGTSNKRLLATDDLAPEYNTPECRFEGKYTIVEGFGEDGRKEDRRKKRRRKASLKWYNRTKREAEKHGVPMYKWRKMKKKEK